jgi:protein tyrosine phosphatase
MEPWFSGAVVDAVREAKAHRALFIVYVRDDSEQSQSMDQLWSDVWIKFDNTSKIIALRLNKDTEGCKQFIAIYKVQIYPTIYLINGQNGQVLKMIDQSLENSNKLQEIIEDSLNIIEPKQQTTKTVEEKVIN